MGVDLYLNDCDLFCMSSDQVRELRGNSQEEIEKAYLNFAYEVIVLDAEKEHKRTPKSRFLATMYDAAKGRYERHIHEIKRARNAGNQFYID